MTIAAILATKGSEVATIEASLPLSAAANELARRKIGALIVIDGGQVVGIVSERDLVTCLAKRGGSALDEPVAAAMTAPAISVDPAMPVLGALAMMTQRRFRHLPIMKDGQLIGLVSIGDLVKYRIESIERDAEGMRSYIQNA